MKIIKPSYEILSPATSYEDMLNIIEIGGRICYASEPNNTSTEKFVNNLINRGHTSVLEHGTVYLYFVIDTTSNTDESAKQRLYEKYNNNNYSKVRCVMDHGIAHHYITTNYRVIIDNNWKDDLKYVTYEPHMFHYKRVSVIFTTQVAIDREINRHRTHSPSGESTRYCNYSKDKFTNEIRINKPSFITPSQEEDYISHMLSDCRAALQYYCNLIANDNDQFSMTGIDYWLFGNLSSEYSYLNMLKSGYKPEDARSVLPLDLNSKLMHTAFVSDWLHFFELRAEGVTGKPHPDVKVLAEPLMNEFKNRGLI